MQRETPYETIYLLRRKRHKREAFQEYLLEETDLVWRTVTYQSNGHTGLVNGVYPKESFMRLTREEYEGDATAGTVQCVLQDWVSMLPMMQQTVLLTATRAPDGLRKHHPVKTLCRWLRRCYLLSAFDRCVLVDPYDPRGGSFMGPCRTKDVRDIDHAAQLYIECGDEIPLHFHFHLQQAAEILGYKHPVKGTREWWYRFYLRLVAFAHLNPETEAQMHRRLQDNEETWREREA